MSKARAKAAAAASSDEDEDDRPIVGTGRRVSVSAESMNPGEGAVEKVSYPKSDAQRQRILTAVRNNFLFKRLEDELLKEVIDAMFEKRVASGEEIIKQVAGAVPLRNRARHRVHARAHTRDQGAPGDNFYVVESGTFDVFVQKGDKPAVKVVDYSAGASFGELALMYNAPRAATVRATSDSIVWALDRNSFRRMLMDTTFKKRRLYEHFLEEVALLKPLETYERHKIADALEIVSFEENTVVIKQGDVGETFYIIESGEADVSQTDADGKSRHIITLKKGDYFGELALLTDKPRAASVTSKGRLKTLTLNKGGFDRLLGPCQDILKRNADTYQKYSTSM
eukprot:Unigene3514_Nuclearia_a/m.10736 Unigene3514_Nuclearia_a/g.10736  ORF Unigene3514_Nuclearia_a/g.10736 Unigene3514_Nuclearia_a/m.10736 type:complete len:340 (-) Unigene3514_Nuclearia_a:405-1424(-)